MKEYRSQCVVGVINIVNTIIYTNCYKIDDLKDLNLLKQLSDIGIDVENELNDIYENYKEEYLEGLENKLDCYIEQIDNLICDMDNYKTIESYENLSYRLNDLRDNLFDNIDRAENADNFLDFISNCAKEFRIQFPMIKYDFGKEFLDQLYKIGSEQGIEKILEKYKYEEIVKSISKKEEAINLCIELGYKEITKNGVEPLLILS